MAATRITTTDIKDATVATADLQDDCVTKDKLGILTTKGDLITFSTEPIRLASSATNNDVLTVDTTTTSGLKWAAAAGGAPTALRTLSTDPASPATGDIWFNTVGSTVKIRDGTGSMIYARSPVPAVVASTAVTASTAVVEYDNSRFTMPAAWVVAGRTFRCRAWGTYTTPVTAGMGISLILRASGTVTGAADLARSTVLAAPSSVTTKDWALDGILTYRSGAVGFRSSLRSSLNNGLVEDISKSASINVGQAGGIWIFVAVQHNNASISSTCEGCVWELIA